MPLPKKTPKMLPGCHEVTNGIDCTPGVFVAAGSTMGCVRAPLEAAVGGAPGVEAADRRDAAAAAGDRLGLGEGGVDLAPAFRCPGPVPPEASPVSAWASAAPPSRAAPTPALSAPAPNHADTRNGRPR